MKTKVCRAMALSLVVVSLVGCDSSDDSIGTGTVHGIVDSSDLEMVAAAVQGVIVHLDGEASRSAITDADGVFIFLDVPSGEYVVSFESNGELLVYVDESGVPLTLFLGTNQWIEFASVRIRAGEVHIASIEAIDIDSEGNPIEVDKLPPPQPDGKWYIVCLYPNGSQISSYIATEAWGITDEFNYITRLFVSKSLYARAVAECNQYGPDARFDLETGEPLDPAIGEGRGYTPPTPDPEPGLPPLNLTVSGILSCSILTAARTLHTLLTKPGKSALNLIL